MCTLMRTTSSKWNYPIWIRGALAKHEIHFQARRYEGQVNKWSTPLDTVQVNKLAYLVNKCSQWSVLLDTGQVNKLSYLVNQVTNIPNGRPHPTPVTSTNLVTWLTNVPNDRPYLTLSNLLTWISLPSHIATKYLPLRKKCPTVKFRGKYIRMWTIMTTTDTW